MGCSVPSLSPCFLLLLLVFGSCMGQDVGDDSLKISTFSDSGSGNFSSLVLDALNYQVIVGGRNGLYRLRLEDLSLLEKAEWPAKSPDMCLIKGQTLEECQNYVRLIHPYKTRLFVCGTNAFKPQCAWRSSLRIQEVVEWIDGRGKCPYSPYSSVASLLTQKGTLYTGTSIDFMSYQHAIYSMDGASNGFKNLLSSSTSDYRWLSQPEFISIFETDAYVYFLFREVAVEDYGKSIYSRIARICKNDQGESRRIILSTFLKARLNCSNSGETPFYYNHLTSATYKAEDDIIYGTFSTGENAIHGSAVCSFSMSDVDRAFDGDFLHQKSPDFVWKSLAGEHEHFKCKSQGSQTHTSREYQLVEEAVHPSHSGPIYHDNNEKYSHIVVDRIQNDEDEILHILFVATRRGQIKKINHNPRTFKSCLIEVLRPFGSSEAGLSINDVVFMKETLSLYLTTDENIVRLDLNTCHTIKRKEDCLSLMDPYCGWDGLTNKCVSQVQGKKPHVEYRAPTCPSPDERVDGKWSMWSSWEVCTNKDPSLPYSDSKCLCRQRSCSNPAPLNGGSTCSGVHIETSNCTRNGAWTEWSDFGSCSQSCDAGMKARKRYCSNPSPAHGGKPCIGRDVEHQYCNNLPPCKAAPGPTKETGGGGQSKVVSPWSEWSNCSSTCNEEGFMTRTRVCFPTPCEDGCDIQYKKCPREECQDTLKISDLTPWFMVNSSGSSDSWTEKRYQFTYNVPAHLKDSAFMKEEKRLCTRARGCEEVPSESPSTKASSWFEWTACNKPCGGGQQIKIRSCRPNEENCGGVTLIERPCNMEPCPPKFHCWSEWSLCGGGGEKNNNIRRRTRVCPLGESCPPEDMMQEEECLSCPRGVVCERGELNALSSHDACADKSCPVSVILISLFSGFVGGIFCGGIAIFLFMKYKRSFIESIVSPKYVSAKSQNLYVSLPLWDIQNKQISGLNESKNFGSDESDDVSIKNPRNSLTFHSALDNLEPDKHYS